MYQVVEDPFYEDHHQEIDVRHLVSLLIRLYVVFQRRLAHWKTSLIFVTK